MGASRPLSVRPPSFVAAPPERCERALNALATLYRDYIAHQLDSRAEKSVDVDGQTGPPLKRRFE